MGTIAPYIKVPSWNISSSFFVVDFTAGYNYIMEEKSLSCSFF
jgi:hypothetical protein